MENNQQILLASSVLPGMILKRLKRECELLFPLVDALVVTEDRIKNSIILTFQRKNKNTNKNKNKNINNEIHYSFEINKSNEYPFKPPSIRVNGKSYDDMLKLVRPSFYHILNEWKGIQCFCCHSFLCDLNWSPNISLIKVIDEVERILYIKHGILIRDLIDKIKYKYLNCDIDLFSWIYA